MAEFGARRAAAGAESGGGSCGAAEKNAGRKMRAGPRIDIGRSRGRGDVGAWMASDFIGRWGGGKGGRVEGGRVEWAGGPRWAGAWGEIRLGREEFGPRGFRVFKWFS